jgi:hypothetical protein
MGFATAEAGSFYEYLNVPEYGLSHFYLHAHLVSLSCASC